MNAVLIAFAPYLLVGAMFTAAAAVENQTHLLGCYDRLADACGEAGAVVLVLAGSAPA